MASASSAPGPFATIQAIFIWGRPQIFDRPLRVNVSASRFEAKLNGRTLLQGEIEKHFVGDQSQLAGCADGVEFLRLVAAW